MVTRPAAHRLGRVVTRKVAAIRTMVALRSDARSTRAPGLRAVAGQMTAAVRMIIWGHWPARQPPAGH